MLTDQQLADAFTPGREQGSVEFKAPGAASERRLVASVIRAMIGMSNRRDGGNVVVGVMDHGDRIDPIGIGDADLRTWTFDTLSDLVSRYAEPSIDFDMRIATVDSRRFVLIRVSEFAEVPTLCRRDFNEGNRVILREGACYIRPRRKPETVEVAAYVDMRDLIELATEKGVRRFLSSVQRAEITTVADFDDNAAFDAQAQDFL